MTGQRFGRWTVLDRYERIPPKGEMKWLCRCDCGTQRYVRERSLRYGGSLSCGCFQREQAAQMRSKDLAGQVFGELTVLKKVESPEGTGTWWLCRCACGGECTVQSSLLTGGRKRHCGSQLHARNYAFVDVTGKRFGRLTALYPLQDKRARSSRIWHCRCDCGNEVDVAYNSLMYSNQVSCGCSKREHVQELHSYLNHIAGTSVELIQSQKLPKDNTTGYKGVYLKKGKYVAKINFQKKPYYLGTYDDIQAAAEARKEAEEVLFAASAEYLNKWKRAAEADPEWARQNPAHIAVSQTAEWRMVVAFTPDLTGR